MEQLNLQPPAVKLPRSRDFLNRLRRKIADNEGKRGLVSDYHVASVLKVTTATVSSWRTGRFGIGDETGLKVAAILGLDERYVLACLNAERHARNAAVKSAWQRIAAAGLALPMLLILLAALTGTPQAARAAGEFYNSIHYAQRRRRRSWHGTCSLSPVPL